MTDEALEARPLGYALLDAGDGRRLERFGPYTVDRPAPTAEPPRRDFAAWRRSDYRFDPGRGWTAAGAPVEPEDVAPWAVSMEDGLMMELRLTGSGRVGVYPEHAANVAWLAARIAERQGERQRGGEPPAVLNLFAHTGLLTLAAARAGAAVTHVDAARSAVAWARRNAELSGLADRPVRWIVDDASGFVAREARRGRRYDGIVLDPPSFGRAGRRPWKLADELPALLAACRDILQPDAFVVLTAHTTGLDGEDLAGLLRIAMGVEGPGDPPIEVGQLGMAADSGARLALGWAVRMQRVAGTA